jgi:hypothetical protein
MGPLAAVGARITIICSGVGCYQISLSYGFFASCLWTRFYGRLELRGLTSQVGQQFKRSWTRRRWEAARNDCRVGRQHSVGLCAQGIEEGRTRCCQSAVSEQCLRNPNLVFDY